MSRKLIVADESIIIQKTVALVFSDRNFIITPFSNGKEVLGSLTSEVPDIVLADIDLSGMDGYELCRTVKKNPDLKTVKIILLAAAVKGIDDNKAKEAGADDYIIKPFKSEELISKIDAALASNGDIAQLRGELERLRKELQMSKEGADEISRELLNKAETVDTLNDTITGLQEALRLAEEKAGKINREFIEKTLLQAMPEITSRAVDEIIRGTLMSELNNAIEKSVEEKIPYAIENAIKEKIEELKKGQSITDESS